MITLKVREINEHPHVDLPTGKVEMFNDVIFDVVWPEQGNGTLTITTRSKGFTVGQEFDFFAPYES